MHQQLGSIKADALVEDAMGAPGRLSYQVDEGSLVSETHGSAKKSSVDHIHSTIVPVDLEMSENGMVLEKCVEQVNGDSHNMATDPTTEMEGFIMREHDIHVIQEPVAETDAITKIRSGEAEQLLTPSDQAGVVNVMENFLPERRRVQWSDNHGKELVHVYEYEASDTGDSDEDDDDADAHACTCSIQ